MIMPRPISRSKLAPFLSLISHSPPCDCSQDFTYKVLPDLNGSDHYPVLVSLVYPNIPSRMCHKMQVESNRCGLTWVVTLTLCITFHLPSKSSKLPPGRNAQASIGSRIQWLRTATPTLRTSSLVCLIGFSASSFSLEVGSPPLLFPSQNLARILNTVRTTGQSLWQIACARSWIRWLTLVWCGSWNGIIAFPPSSLVSGYAALPLTISCSLNKISTMLSHGSTSRLLSFLTSSRPMILHGDEEYCRPCVTSTWEKTCPSSHSHPWARKLAQGWEWGSLFLPLTLYLVESLRAVFCPAHASRLQSTATIKSNNIKWLQFTT